MAKIKICGLKREEDILYVNEIKPDYIGFILSGGFKRSIDREKAVKLKSMLSRDIKAVGVFVNEDIKNIEYFLNNSIIDIVQLHGDESAQYVNELKSKTQAKIIKYFSPENFGKIRNYQTDYFLFDSGKGSGKTFDWSKIPDCDTPYFLAGGINRDNIKFAIEKLNPYCIDVSSAVETNGFKDYQKIKELTEMVRDE